MIPKNKAAPEPGSTRETLRARGLRLTNPRRIILDVVRATDAHPTATWVYRAVRRKLPRVSLATVYRNLRTLAEEGLLAERAGVSGMRFDGKTGPHDHFTCVACGRIFDVSGGASRARTRVAPAPGFEVLSHRIELYGRCRGCRQRRPRRSLTRQRTLTRQRRT